jgi:hypothetical protein
MNRRKKGMDCGGKGTEGRKDWIVDRRGKRRERNGLSISINSSQAGEK